MTSFLFLGLGPISRRFIESLLEKDLGIQIKILTSLEPEKSWPKNVTRITKESLFMPAPYFDFVINSWKELNDDKIEILDFLGKNAHERMLLINFSTVGVYGNYRFQVTEDCPALPVNVYGRVKREIELILQNTFTNVMNLRISNVFGDERFKDFVNLAVFAHINNRGFEIVEPTRVFRDLYCICELVNFLCRLVTDIQESSNEFCGYLDLNVGSGYSYSLQEIVLKIEYFSNRQFSFNVKNLSEEIIETSFINVSQMKLRFPRPDYDPNSCLESFLHNRISPKL